MTAIESNGLKRYLVTHAATWVVAILVQSAALIWWASSLNTRVHVLDRDVQKIDSRVHALEVATK